MLFKVLVSLAVFVGLPLSSASLFFLPLVFVFVLVGELVSVSVSVFVFVDVPLLVALFVIVGLLLLVIPKVFFSLTHTLHFIECARHLLLKIGCCRVKRFHFISS